MFFSAFRIRLTVLSSCLPFALCSVHLFQIMWFCKVYPLQRNTYLSLPEFFNRHCPRKNRRLVYHIEKRLIKLSGMMNDMQLIWDARWHAERTLPGLFPYECRTMLDTFPTRVRLPLRYSLARCLVNPKYGGAVLKVRTRACLIFISIIFECAHTDHCH